MNKFIGMLVVLGSSSFIYAADCPSALVLDKVMFRVAAKQWVSTQTALLTVTINATLTDADLVKVRTNIMSKLAKIAAGEWHLIQFDRSQDSSGLEKLNVTAQIRIEQGNLTTIYQNAKAVSKPGENYQVGSIEFKPSLDELQQVRAQLRIKLYQQVNDELAQINKVYNGQKYSLNNLAFVEDGEPIQLRNASTREMVMVAGAGSSSPPLSVSNELTMTAVVEAASNREK